MKRVLGIGCTGLIGQRLVAQLVAAGHQVRLLTRAVERARAACAPAVADAVEWQHWEGNGSALQAAWIADRDALINLAGAGIADQRWTADRKQVLHDSRIEPTRQVIQAAAEHEVEVVINASAIGWYGWPEHPVDETAPAGDVYLAELTAAWEAALAGLSSDQCRVVKLRIGVVLAAEGGALAEMVRPGLPLARLGSGRQPFAWIHIDDVVGMIVASLTDDRWHGPINAVAPATDTHGEVIKALAQATRKWSIPIGVPGWALRIALGEMASMLLNGAKVIPARAQELHYAWRFPEIQAALADCYPSESA